MKKVCVLVAMALAMSFANAGLAAPAHAYPAKVKSSCRGDFKRFCKAYGDSGAKLRRCISASRGQLSGKCFNALKDAGYR